jgi:MerR family transcriptional regulator/heat shock protein HspR
MSGAAPAPPEPEDRPELTVSAAARLAALHAQTLRHYDLIGLVVPKRAAGGGRRYSRRDVATLIEVRRLSTKEGVTLAGIARIIELRAEVRRLRREVEELRKLAYPGQRVFAVSGDGDAIALARGERLPAAKRTSSALVVWRG